MSAYLIQGHLVLAVALSDQINKAEVQFSPLALLYLTPQTCCDVT